MAVLSPGNRRAVQPNDALNRARIPAQASSALRNAAIAIQTVGNSNFTFSTPAITVPGRGLNLSLNLTYNSLVWTVLSSAANNVYFDIDGDWPAPGFNLTFGKLVSAGNLTAMFIDGAGDRHPFTATSASGASTFTGYTTDGTLIDYSATFDSGGNIMSGQLQYPDGSAIAFNAAGANAVHATQLTDRNGNYITITYSSTQSAPAIELVEDTLGRMYQFNYDTNGLLVGITGPGLAGATRELIHFTYQALPTLQAIIGGQTVAFTSPLGVAIQPYAFQFLQSITYPGVNNGYWLGDTNSYSAYGMIAKLSERVAMALGNNTYTTQGSVINTGVVRRETTYNYPLMAQSLTTLPNYTTATDTWANMDTSPAVTTYAVTENANPRNVVMTTPDQITTVQKSYNSPGTAYLDGLTYRIETHTGGPSGPLVGALDFTYEEGSRGNARLTSIKTTDEKGQTTQTSYGYTPSLSYDQLFNVANFGFSSETLRTTMTSYSTDPGYTARHIYNVPIEVDIYDNSGTQVSRTVYSYDTQRGQQLVDAAPAGSQHLTGHLDTFNPFEPVECQPPVCHQVCITANCIVTCHTVCVPGPCSGYYVPATDYRGNLSALTVYSNAAAATGALEQTFQYDITGNTVATASAAGVTTAIGYTSNTNFAYPESASVGSGAAIIRTAATYDFGTGGQTSATDASGQTTSLSYDPSSLRIVSALKSTGAHTDVIYVDSLFSMNATTYLGSGTSSIGTETLVTQNGLGLAKLTQTLAEPQSSQLFDSTLLEYDAMGRVAGQSLPYRAGGLQVSAGSFTTVTYDFAGRVVSQLEPDGVSASHVCYNEYACYKTESSPSTSAGETVRIEDAWGRQRWTRSDALGRIVEAVEPNPTGATGSVSDTGALHTAYSYDGLDNPIQITQGAQTRTFVYDSLSRLTAQALAEKAATLNATGAYVGSGSYSDVFIYSQSTGNLSTRVDARGVQIVQTYETGGLNRLTGLTYNLAGVGDTTQAVASTANVTYNYVPSGDLTRLLSEVVGGVATETFGYDSFGRLSSVETTLAARPSYPLETDYAYDTIDRLTGITYPVPYGFGATHRVVSTPLGVDGRPKQVLVDAAQTPHATGLTYTAAGAVAAATIGIAAQYQGAEQYTYEPASGFLQSQVVQQSGTDLLNLTYSYTHARIGATTGSFRTGQLVSISNGLNATEGRTYGYDALARLVSAKGGNPTGTAQWSQTYTYDRYGNRLGVTASGNASGTGGPIPIDGLASIGFGTDSTSNRVVDSGWVYDNAGNVLRGRISASTWEQFQYDGAGRLIAVCKDGGVGSTGRLVETCTAAGGATSATVVESYTYGPDRERLVVQSGSDLNGRRYYARANHAIIMEYTETDAAPTTPSYAKATVLLGQRLLSTATPSAGTEAWQFYHPDRLGARLIVTGATPKEQITLPFGTEVAAESTGGTNYRFTSYDRNETTALDYAINRYYGAAPGRFSQVDPLGNETGSTSDPQSFNGYAYSRNDPLNIVDPLGLDWDVVYCTITVSANYATMDGTSSSSSTFVCGLAWYPNSVPQTPSNVGGGGGGSAAPANQCTSPMQAPTAAPTVTPGLFTSLMNSVYAAVTGGPPSASSADLAAGMDEMAHNAAMIGVGFGGGVGGDVLASDVFAAGRVTELMATDAAYVRRSVTISVGVGTNAAGEGVVLVGSSEGAYPRPGLTLAPGEIWVGGEKIHAETNIVNYAAANNISLSSVGASNGICPGCQAAIKGAGANCATRLKGAR